MPEPLDRPQQVLADRYRIERELGPGVMATVCLGYDLKHDSPVALKVADFARLVQPKVARLCRKA